MTRLITPPKFNILAVLKIEYLEMITNIYKIDIEGRKSNLIRRNDVWQRNHT